MPIGLVFYIGFTLALPILIVLIASLINPFAQFLSDLFINLLGNIPIFSAASNILQAAVGTVSSPQDFIVATTISVIGGALLDAAVIGACVFFLKAILSNFSQSGALWYSFGSRKVLSAHVTTVGIIIGTVVVTMIGNSKAQLQGLLYSVISIALLLIGVLLMLNHGRVVHKREKRDGLIINLLFGMFINMLEAVIWAIIITTCMLGGAMICNGLPFTTFLQFFFAEAVAYFIISFASWFVTRKPRND